MKNKYHARKITVDGMVFDSRKEYQRYCLLRQMEQAGEIRGLKRQVRYTLIPSQRINGKVVERAATYIADFVYEQDGETVVEDVKGYRKGIAYALFTIKRKLMLERHGLRVKEV